MKLLPRLEAITGEVKCGRHNVRIRLGDSSWCKLPANHTGRCVRGPISGNIGIEEKVYGSSHRGGKNTAMFDYLNQLGHEGFGPEWSNVDEDGFEYDGGGFHGPPHIIFGIDWAKGEGPQAEDRTKRKP